MTRCEKKNLVLNWEKCHFMVTFRIFLGHIIFKKEIELDKKKIELIFNFHVPKTVRDIRSFLGHTGFIKDLLVHAPIMQPLYWSLPFELMYDVNDFAIGAVLGQIKEKSPMSYIMLVIPLIVPK